MLTPSVRAATCALLLILAASAYSQTTPTQQNRAPRAPRPKLPELVIESLTGPITPAEIAAFKTHVAAIPTPTANTGNNFVYGTVGSATEAIGMMYEATGDQEILDRMIFMADNMLHSRNNPETGRVLWTGERDEVWPNKAAGSADEKSAANENGDVVGHIAYCARLILADADLQKQKCPDDPFNYGATYGERARTYVREMDRTMDAFIEKYMVDPKTFEFRSTTDPRFANMGERAARAMGKLIPWNQQAMLANGFQRMAECHELLGDDPARVERYDKIVKTYIDGFLKAAHLHEVDGHTCAVWSYAADDPNLRYKEDAGHAGYDILGLWRAWQRPKYEIKKEQLEPYANTVRYVMYKGDNTFAWRVDGMVNEKVKTRDYLGGSFLSLADVDPEIYDILAGATRERAKGQANAAAWILFMKHRRAKGN